MHHLWLHISLRAPPTLPGPGSQPTPHPLPSYPSRSQPAQHLSGQEHLAIVTHQHHQKAFRNKSLTSHGQRPGPKRNKSKGKSITIN